MYAMYYVVVRELLQLLSRRVDEVRRVRNLYELSRDVRHGIALLQRFHGLRNTFMYLPEPESQKSRLRERGKTHGGRGDVRTRLLLQGGCVLDMMRNADMEWFTGNESSIYADVRGMDPVNPIVYHLIGDKLKLYRLGDFADGHGWVRFSTFELSLNYVMSMSRYQLQPINFEKVEGYDPLTLAREYLDEWCRLVENEKGRQFAIDDPDLWPGTLPWNPNTKDEMPMVVWFSVAPLHR